MEAKIGKQVVKSLNEDLKKLYIAYMYENIENRDYFKVVSHMEYGHERWGICISDVGLYGDDHAIDSPDYDINKDPFNALKQHITEEYNAYLKELAL